MRIVILAGGSGSIALQRGLYHAVEKNRDGVDTRILVNAYDNGLSTGAVRRVMNGQILGPSDVRKNHATRLQLENPESPWLPFLSFRFSVGVSEARHTCETEVIRLIETLERREHATNNCSMLFDAIDAYFRSPIAAQIVYDDFSLANIIYAGLAKINGNSLRTAARIIAATANIPDSVLLNDDKSLFLGAVSQSGKRVADEGGIVSWGNAADPFVDTFFCDANGNPDRPTLCLEAWQALGDADLVILSPGTQWSSLIPTYASCGFKDAIRDCPAKIIMVMNRTPDKDSPSQTASDIIKILVPRYFDAGRLHVLADECGHPQMRALDAEAHSRVASFTSVIVSNPADQRDKHDPRKLAQAIGCVFFRDYLDSDLYIFDYDDTLVGRQDRYPKSSRFNVDGVLQLHSMTKVGICTGNAVTEVKLRCASAEKNASPAPLHNMPLLVFADGGLNKYAYDTRFSAEGASHPPDPDLCLSPETLLPMTGHHGVSGIISALTRAGIPASKINNRGNALIAIKPVDQEHRRAVTRLASYIVRGSGLEVSESGSTTVEIRSPSLSKIVTFRYLRANSTQPPTITYVGDEFESGNDRDIQEYAKRADGVKCLSVRTPAKTAFFISTLLSLLRHGAR